jgi:transposase
MQRKLSMRKIAELLRLKYEVKLPHRSIAASLGISAGSVSEYVKRAQAAKITWPLPKEMTEEQLHQKLFPSRSQDSPPPVPDWQMIHQEMRRKGMTLQLLWQEYLTLYPNGLSYSQFCRKYHSQRNQLEPVMRFNHRAGENCFVDYAGMTMPWIDPRSGEIHEAQIFVGCLGASNYTYVEATQGQTLREWLSSHANMFDYFQGVPQNCIPDNLKSGVTKAHRYDPDINLTYQHFAEYYGVAILPTRVVKPRDKAKVENAVLCVERQIIASLRYRTFTSLSEINQALKSALIAYNAKSFQKLAGSRLSFFQALDKPALKPLPPHRYEWSEWRQVKVHMDYHIVFDKHYYSVPYRLIGQLLKVRATSTLIECYFNLTKVACHRRAYRSGFTTLKEHMPSHHQNLPDASVQYFIDKAALVGPQTQLYVDELMKHRAFPQQAFRACQGILKLGQRYGQERLESACKRALFLGAYRYRDIETMLRNGLESAALQNDETPLQLPNHANLRGSDYYQ